MPAFIPPDRRCGAGRWDAGGECAWLAVLTVLPVRSAWLRSSVDSSGVRVDRVGVRRQGKKRCSSTRSMGRQAQIMATEASACVQTVEVSVPAVGSLARPAVERVV